MATFERNFHGAEIILVGCGGTGSQVARHLARMIYDLRSRNIEIPRIITFVDPDIIERKNVGRQMFSAGEIGKHKAQVLAGRFNRIFGLNIRFINEPFDSAMTRKDHRPIILIGAVDGHEGRRAMADSRYGAWIDAGNKVSAGQVSFGTSHDMDELGRVNTSEDVVRALPDVAWLFPEMLEPESAPSPLSCADLMTTGDQDILINDMMGNVASQYLKKLLYRQPISTFCTYVDSDLMSMRSVPINKDSLDFYINREDVA